jgi:hypothetical protein
VEVRCYNVGAYGAGTYSYWDPQPLYDGYNPACSTVAGFGAFPDLVSGKVLANYSADAGTIYNDSACYGRALSVAYGLLPGIKCKGQIPNDLLELKDLLSIGRVLSNAKNLLRTWRHSIKNGMHYISSLRKSRKLVSDALLTWSFGIAPTASDVFYIWRTLKSVDQQLKDFIADQNKIRRVHGSFNLHDLYVPDSSAKVHSTFPSEYGGSNLWKNQSYSVLDGRVTLVYSYTWPGIYDAKSRIGALCDALGFNLDPSIIWNAIPWSFVVDWLFGVSDFISRFKVANITPATVIRGSLYSVHVRRLTDIFFEYQPSSPRYTGDMWVASLDEETYQRLPLSLDSISLATRGLNSGEFIIAGALASSKS